MSFYGLFQDFFVFMSSDWDVNNVKTEIQSSISLYGVLSKIVVAHFPSLVNWWCRIPWVIISPRFKIFGLKGRQVQYLLTERSRGFNLSFTGNKMVFVNSRKEKSIFQKKVNYIKEINHKITFSLFDYIKMLHPIPNHHPYGSSFSDFVHCYHH